MPTKIAVYRNEDDCFVAWSVSSPIPGCLGFAVQRELTRAGKTSKSWLENRVGFATEKPQPGAHRPSTEWPFQRFTWTDHGTDTGDTARYRVVPMVQAPGGALKPEETLSSDWSEAVTLGDDETAPYQAFFNRGFVISQFMASYLKRTKKTLAQFKATIQDKDDKTIRRFLAGDLRTRMLALIAAAKKAGDHVYAALFELDDDELVEALCGLGSHAHVVLANGSITKQENETTAEARKRDENAAARQKLLDAGSDVVKKDRFLSPGALAHNKFLVVTDAKKPPTAKLAWTGSTNWTPTGLCTQLNNGLLIRDRAVARVFLEQWHALRDAKSVFPPQLVAGNSQPRYVGKDVSGKIRATIWFTRTSKSVDLETLKSEVNRAEQAILFLMFMPGASGPLGEIIKRVNEPGLYIRGAVSTLPAGPSDESELEVALVDGKNTRSNHYDVIEPQGIAHPFAYWAEEVTRKQFLAGIGHAIIHSKVIVIDPFSNDPTVITGSHNFSASASSKNDENFIIVRGDRALAEAYVVNVMAAWDHYRWRAYVSGTTNPWSKLSPDDSWMASTLAGDRRDLAFWGV